MENLQSGSQSVNLLTTNDKYNYLNGGILRKFSQTEFFESFVGTGIGLDYYGWIFIPPHCLSNKCKVHMVFHGSNGGVSSFVQRGFIDILENGYIQYGMANNIIMIFPQAKVELLNAEYKWNIEGYLQIPPLTGTLMNILGIVEPWLEPQVTNESIQMKAFLKMFERVCEPKDDSVYSYEDNVEINYLKMNQDQRDNVQKEVNWNHIWELVWQVIWYQKPERLFELQW